LDWLSSIFLMTVNISMFALSTAPFDWGGIWMQRLL
jgi:hypothetical protein